MLKLRSFFMLLAVLLLTVFCAAQAELIWFETTDAPQPDVYSDSPTPQPEGSWQSGMTLPAISASLNTQMSLRTGPGTRYTELLTYPADTEICVYQKEVGGAATWVMVEYRITGGLQRAYTGIQRIDADDDIPWANTIPTDAVTAAEIIPRFGPGAAYVPCKKKLPAGTELQIFHEEQGYVMADFKFPGDRQPTRAWIPLVCVANYQSVDFQVFVTATPAPTPKPTPSPIPITRYSTFDTAGNITAFVDSRDRLWLCGQNNYGQCGTGRKGNNVFSSRRILENVVDVQLGFYFGTALDADGNVYAWGRNEYGSVGVGSESTKTVTKPTKIKLGDVVELAAGDEHALAMISDGSLYAWGRNQRGQLGNGSTKNGYSPKKISTPGEVMSFTAGDYNTALILTDGTLWMCGDNSRGQLGLKASDKPVTSFVQLPLQNVAQVSVGDYHVVALTEDGKVYTWGSNEYGQLGNWQLDDKESQPQLLVKMDNVRAVNAGDYHTFVLCHNGDLYAFGRNDNGQLGNGETANAYQPQLVQTDVREMDTGYAHTVVVKNDGTIWGAGRNEYGSLGLEETGLYTDWTRLVPLPY